MNDLEFDLMNDLEFDLQFELEFDLRNGLVCANQRSSYPERFCRIRRSIHLRFLNHTATVYYSGRLQLTCIKTLPTRIEIRFGQSRSTGVPEYRIQVSGTSVFDFSSLFFTSCMTAARVLRPHAHMHMTNCARAHRYMGIISLYTPFGQSPSVELDKNRGFK